MHTCLKVFVIVEKSNLCHVTTPVTLFFSPNLDNHLKLSNVLDNNYNYDSKLMLRS